MKNTIFIISTFLLLLLTLLLGEVFNNQLHKEKLHQRVVKVLPENKSFIKPEEVKKMMQITDSLSIDIKRFESKLEKNEFIDEAEVYRDLNGNLIAEVTQYKPIARVLGSQSYYLDENGRKRPLSHHYTEKVVLIRGNVDTKMVKILVAHLQLINKDALLKDIISEMSIKPFGYSCRLKGIKAVFYLKSKQPEEQFKKLKIMYAYLVKHHLTRKYNQIDLRYDKQAVCK